MDEEFLQRITDIELRLEAEGMYFTAEAIRKVVNAYICDHSIGLMHQCGRNKLEEDDLTPPR